VVPDVVPDVVPEVVPEVLPLPLLDEPVYQGLLEPELLVEPAW